MMYERDYFVGYWVTFSLRRSVGWRVGGEFAFSKLFFLRRLVFVWVGDWVRFVSGRYARMDGLDGPRIVSVSGYVDLGF